MLMPLKMTLEPQEWLMVGDTRIVNIWNETSKFKIDGAAPVLRQAHTISKDDADTPAKRVYYSMQKLYLGIDSCPDEYFGLVKTLLAECPSAAETVQKANTQIANGSFYGALREYRKLLL
jgi:flagellar protein FlbT